MAANDRLERHAGHLFVLIILVLTAGIVLGGFFYYRNYERNYRAQVELQLSAIADLKVSELVRWRNERLSDGPSFMTIPTSPMG